MKIKVFGKILGTFMVALLALGVGVTLRASAGTENNVFGFAWGGNEAVDTNGAFVVPNNGAIDGDENGFGWVSFNSTDCDTDDNGIVDLSEVRVHPGCPAGTIASYGVNIPEGDGGLSGYAWSEHFGWISFNATDLARCPSGSCKAERIGNQIKGWARILSIRDAGANAGGWSGWIQLDPLIAGPDTVTLDVASSPHKFKGYAYSDELGWLQFNPAQGGVFYENPSTVDLKINGKDAIVSGEATLGTPLNITWTSTDTQSCTAVAGYGFNNISIGKNSTDPPTNGPIITQAVFSSLPYKIECTGLDGTTAFDEVPVTLLCVRGCDTSWSACSKACGTGTQSRTCTSSTCDSYPEEQSCNTNACNQSSWREVAPE